MIALAQEVDEVGARTEHNCRFVPFAIGRDGGKVFYRNRCTCGRWEHPNDPDIIAFDNGQVVQ